MPVLVLIYLRRRQFFPLLWELLPQVQYQQIFYTSPSLLYGEHTLAGSCVDEGEVILDYLVVQMPLDLSTNTSSPIPSTAPHLSPAAKPTRPIATIVGSVLGLLLIMTILIVLLWYRYLRGTETRLIEPEMRSQPPDSDTSSIYSRHNVLVAAEFRKSPDDAVDSTALKSLQWYIPGGLRNDSTCSGEHMIQVGDRL